MLRLKFTIFILFFWGVNNLQAQTDEEVIPYVEPKGTSNWFLEFGGAALFWSANYEKYLYRNYNHSFTITGRIGFGYCPIEYRLLNSVYLDQNSQSFEIIQIVNSLIQNNFVLLHLNQSNSHGSAKLHN
jgi:hypothetical protein